MRPFALLLFLTAPQLATAAVAITGASVHQTEDGSPLASDAEFVAGETVYFSFQVTGYNTSPVKKLRLNYRIEASDPKGVSIVEPVESILDANLAEEDKEWKPKIREAILIPSVAPPGTYRIVTKVVDDISHLSATAETSFRVGGPRVEPSDELTVRNFGFYRSENEPRPVATAVFRPGDNLFARFNITGFRYGDRNTVQVSYDVAVFTAAGKRLYEQPKAAEEKSFSFYPKPYVPGSMSLSLQQNMKPGEYTIVLTLHDDVGHRTSEGKFPFLVE